jgi:hypothetical protein
MKRYLTFYGAVYYPRGGMDDFIGDFDTKEEAIECIKLKNEKEDGGSFKYCWANVYDTEDRIEVYTQ